MFLFAYYQANGSVLSQTLGTITPLDVPSRASLFHRAGGQPRRCTGDRILWPWFIFFLLIVAFWWLLSFDMSLLSS
ncbi:MAG: hypothetical protein CMJ83_07110 [Planctomycetes bacterium]|nr:hypothetical protein [Planctomycetota bacterium]